MLRNLGRCVVVITGASSGIGRASALRFPREGSRVVLAARAQTPRPRVVPECKAVGRALTTAGRAAPRSAAEG